MRFSHVSLGLILIQAAAFGGAAAGAAEVPAGKRVLLPSGGAADLLSDTLSSAGGRLADPRPVRRDPSPDARPLPREGAAAGPTKEPPRVSETGATNAVPVLPACDPAVTVSGAARATAWGAGCSMGSAAVKTEEVPQPVAPGRTRRQRSF